jgi:ABC-2 type transport system ATP-binding protein
MPLFTKGSTLQRTDCAIRVRDVSKSFVVRHGALSYFKREGRRKTILKDVNLDVRRGELLGLLGPNGVGKTTLLKMMATLVYPDHGTIEVDGVDIKTHPIAARSRIGFCNSDDRSFYFRLTAGENLKFFGALAGLHGRRLAQRIDDTLEAVALGDARDRRFGEFSSGMRQRLVVARALLSDPEILYFDEPTRAVDPINAEELRRLMRDELVANRRKTVVLATNILEEAWTLCDRVAVVSNGTIAAIGPPSDLDRGPRPMQRYRIELEGEERELGPRLNDVPGCDVTAVESDGRTTSISLSMLPGSLNTVLSVTAAVNGHLRSFTAVEPRPIELFKAITNHGS